MPSRELCNKQAHLWENEDSCVAMAHQLMSYGSGIKATQFHYRGLKLFDLPENSYRRQCRAEQDCTETEIRGTNRHFR